MRLPSITCFILFCFFLHDLSGQTTFQKTYGGPGIDVANYVIETNGNYLIAGASSASLSAASDAILIKVDANGDVLWQKKYGGAENDDFHTVAEANGGGYIAAGVTFSNGNGDIFIVHVDDNGNELWSRTVGGGANDEARAVMAIPGGYIVTGTQSSLSSGSADGFAVRLDNNGVTVWTKFYSTDVSNILLAEYVDNGVIYMGGGADFAAAFLEVNLNTGVSISGDLLDGSSTEALYYIRPTLDGNLIQSDHSWSPTGGAEIRQWTRKITKSGTVLWSKVYGSPGTNLRGRTEVCSDGGYLITPWDNFQPASSDPILIKLDANGNVAWSRKYGGPKFDRFLKAEETADGGFIAAGHTKSPNQNGNDDILLVKTNASGLVEGCCIANYDVLVENYSPAKLVMPVVTTQFVDPQAVESNPQTGNLGKNDYCRIPQPAKEIDVQLCEGESIEIGGVAYNQPGTVTDTIPGISGCDTLATYHITVDPAVSITINIEFCPGDSVLIHGQYYSQPGEVNINLPSPNGCDTLATFLLRYSQQPSLVKSIELCEGESIVIDGVSYTQSGQINSVIPATTGCDTLATYILTFNPLPQTSQTIALCEGESIVIDGVSYTQSGQVNSVIPGITGCDTLATYILTFNPLPQTSQTIALCEGESIVIDGVSYTQSGQVNSVIPGITGCDTLAAYTLVFNPLPQKSQVVEFCPGSSVTVNGQVFTAPGTTQAVLPGNTGCDTVLTYQIQYYSLPQPSSVSISCPTSITVDAAPGAGTQVVQYAATQASTDCVCNGLEVSLTQGLASGGNFPVGTTQVCYTAADACGTQNTCCFSVKVNATPLPADPCDVKEIACIRYELLSITADAGGNRTYRIRVTNNCPNKLIYFAVQVPDGYSALEPANNSLWTSEGGRQYEVRNPNYSPFFSVRFKPTGNGIANGASDIFEYTLPAQAGDPLFIHVIVRLEYYVYHEAHLNTFYCPVGVTPLRPAERQERAEASISTQAPFIIVYPNPAQDAFTIDLTDWLPEFATCRLYDLQGRLMWETVRSGAQELFVVNIPSSWPNGLYFIETSGKNGEKRVAKISIQR